MDILLRNGYVVDSANSFEGIRNILIRDGVIASVGHDIPAPEGARVIDCNGKTVIPGICMFISATRVRLTKKI